MIPQVSLLAFGTAVAGPPVVQAILSTFTYTGGGGANEANLYDGNDSTPAADPRGLQTDSSIAYDFGIAETFTNLRVKVADANGFTGNASFTIQYSDASISGSWSNAATINIPFGTGSIVNQAIGAVGAHRYWRIVAATGSLSTNAWFGEVTFQH